MSKNKLFYVICISLIIITISADTVFGGDVRVLILSGRNNHDWKTTTPVIQEILKSNGIKSDVTEEPGKCSAELLDDYDVIVSNYNTFGLKDAKWPDATKKAFTDFLRNGNGHVMVHAGGSSFGAWEDYQRIAAWWAADTGHGRQHAFPINTVDMEHPICEGIYSLWSFDELWHRTGFGDGTKVLMTALSAKGFGGSGEFEPILTVSDFGKGRCVNLMLGHDVAAMRRAAFKLLLTRSVQWAAKEKELVSVPGYLPRNKLSLEADSLTVEKAIENCKEYKYGDDRKELIVLQAKVNSISGDGKALKNAAQQIADSLSTNASDDCKAFLCRLLGQIGSDKQIGALAELLSDEALSMHAIDAMRQISADETVEAIEDVLKTAEGALVPSLLNSLGDLGSSGSVKTIASYLKNEDAVVRISAVYALSRIGSEKACDILLKQNKTAASDGENILAEAVIHCGYVLYNDGENKYAQKAFKSLQGKDKPAFIRKAAFVGYFKSTGKDSSTQLLNALGSDDTVMRLAAVETIKTADDAGMIGQLADKLDSFETDMQIQIISIVIENETKSALGAITKAAGQTKAQVRMPAIKAIGVIGNASSIDLLLGKFENASGEEKAVIHSSIVSLPTTKRVENKLLGLLKKSDGDLLAEIIDIVIDRRMEQAVEELLDIASRGGSKFTNNAVEGLGELADVSVCDDIVQMLDDEQIRLSSSTAAKAIVTICRKSKTNQAEPVIRAFEKVSAETRSELFGVLAALGGEEALKIVNSYTTSNNAKIKQAALNSLYKWKDIAALDMIIAAAKSKEDRQAVPAIRAACRLLSTVEADEAGDYQVKFNAMTKAVRTEQGQKILLSVAPRFASAETLAWTLDRMEQANLQEAAAGAAFEIIQNSAGIDAGVKTAALKQILKSGPDDAIRSEVVRQMYLAKAPRNLALGGTADSPDGLEKDGQASGDGAAIDGNFTTYWDEQNGQNLYRLRVKLAKQETVGAIQITGFQHQDYAPKDFTIELDGKKVKTITGAKYYDNQLLVLLDETKCSTVELKITGYYGASPAIRELAVYGPIEMNDSESFAWKETANTIALTNDGKTVWQFNYAKDLPKPYFHPLGLADGTLLTWNEPADHVWHHAFWFSWKFINGINYWEPADRAKGTYAGVTEWSKVDVKQFDDHSAKIDMYLRYRPAEKPAVLVEKRSVLMGAVDAEGTYTVDWVSKFTAMVDEVVLDRTPIPGEEDGKGWGGYAGFSVRVAKGAEDVRYIGTKGEVELENGTYRGKDKAMQFAGLMGGKEFGITILDHKDNVNSPTPWYLIHNATMDFFSPAVICYEPLTLNKGESITLRYRMIVASGQISGEQINSAYKKYNSIKK